MRSIELFTEGVTDLLGDLVMIVAIIGVMLWMDVRTDAHQSVDGADAVRGDHVVSQRRAEWLTTWCARASRGSMRSCRSTLPERRPSRFSTLKSKSLSTFDRINDKYRSAILDTIFYYAVFFPLVDLIGAIGIALVIWYGGYRIMQNTPDCALSARWSLSFSIRRCCFSPFGTSPTSTTCSGRGGCFAPDLQNARLADCDL